jgi:hypothetical protein
VPPIVSSREFEMPNKSIIILKPNTRAHHGAVAGEAEEAAPRQKVSW